MNLLALLDINTIFFTIWEYPMSYVEFIGTLFTIWSVWLTAKGKVLSWPIGIIGVVFYIFLFYQIQLYSDFFEQIYYFITGFIGWWLWTHPTTKNETDTNKELRIRHADQNTIVLAVVSVIAGTVILGGVMSNIHLYLPDYFPAPAAFPYLDAFTTILSFVATAIMAKKLVECWYMWILVDIIGIWLYYAQGVKFIALEYLLFLIIATKGLLDWKKEFDHENTMKKGDLVYAGS